MGLIILKQKWNDIHENKILFKTITFLNKKMQICKLSISGKFSIAVLFVYINKTPTFGEVDQIGKFLCEQNATFIVGDFNIDRNKEDGRKKIDELCRLLKMQQVNKEITRYSATLDLIFTKKNMNEKTDFMGFVFENLYSDHSTIGFRYCKNGTIDSAYRELQINTQEKEFLRKTTGSRLKDDCNQEESKTKLKKGSDKKPSINTSIENMEDKIIFECPVDIVQSSSIRKLLNNEWLDSNIINCYLYLIGKDFPHILPISSSFNEQLSSRSFLQTDRQFKNNANIFLYSHCLVPVNCHNRHWFLLTIDFSCIEEKKVKLKVYDSLGQLESWKSNLNEKKLRMFIRFKYENVYGTGSTLQITIEDLYKEIPQQSNGIDCGVFTILYAKYIATGQNFTFKQEDMETFRKKIAKEIEDGKLENINEPEFNPAEDFDSQLKEIKSKDVPSTLSRRKLVSRKINFGEKIYFDEAEYKRIKRTESSKSKDKRKRNEENRESADARAKKYGSPDIIIIDDEKFKESSNKRSRIMKQQVSSGLGHLKILKFVNPGGRNLCFSNAVATLLLNIRGITNIIIGHNQLFYENPILQSLKRVYQKQNDSVTSTQNLRRVVEEECIRSNQIRIFNNNQQCDAAEFLQSLFEHLLIDDPHVSRNLFGQTQETIFCLNEICNSADNRPPVDNNIITLELAAPTLFMCLDSFLGHQPLERRCPHCGSEQASQTTQFTEDPEVLIFQLKRFNNNGQKLVQEISVPSRLNLPSGTPYQIIGTANHYGRTINSGHYTASLYDKTTQKFVLVNDETQNEINSLEEIIPGIDPSGNPAPLSTTVYLIVYERQ